jgi:hypothetical protein
MEKMEKKVEIEKELRENICIDGIMQKFLQNCLKIGTEENRKIIWP